MTLEEIKEVYKTAEDYRRPFSDIPLNDRVVVFMRANGRDYDNDFSQELTYGYLGIAEAISKAGYHDLGEYDIDLCDSREAVENDDDDFNYSVSNSILDVAIRWTLNSDKCNCEESWWVHHTDFKFVSTMSEAEKDNLGITANDIIKAKLYWEKCTKED